MATSIINIYQTYITPDRNALVDNIDTYLSTLTPLYTSNDFQYIKLDANIVIKIDSPQQTLTNMEVGNYVTIQQDNKTWYYFLMNATWTSSNTLSLELSIDSINTFRNDLTFSDKTQIMREHKTRLFKQDDSQYLIRNIDRQSEDLNFTGKIQVLQETVRQPNLDYDWYLMYRTSQDLTVENISNPVSCYLFASQPVKIQSASPITSKTYTYEDFNEGMFYYLTLLDNSDGEFSTDGLNITGVDSIKLGQTYTTVVNTGDTIGQRQVLGLVLYRQGTQLYYALQFDDRVIYKTASGDIKYSVMAPVTCLWTDTAPSTLSYATALLSQYNMTEIDSCTITNALFFRVSSTYYQIPEQAYVYATQKMNAYINQGDIILNTIEDIDRTDSRIMKIIKLPYCPVNITYDSSSQIVTFPSEWSYSNGLMFMQDSSLSVELENDNFATVKIPELLVQNTIINPLEPKNIKYESKLYHSDFYTFKFVYDSFFRELRLESFNTALHDTSVNWSPVNMYIPISFKATNTINSKFAFNFNKYFITSEQYDFADYLQTMDYEDYLLISRNNEETIFSNDFINYIRSGYNYDKKLKDINYVNSLISAGLGAISGVGGAIGSYAGNALAPVRNGTYIGGAQNRLADDLNRRAYIGVRGSYANQLLNYQNRVRLGSSLGGITAGLLQGLFSATAQAQVSEINIQKKLSELAIQATVASGSDDVDLLSYYNNNRLQVFKYRVSDISQQILWKLFFYCGYSHPVMKVPNMTSRYWFNYIMCDPKFLEEGNSPFNNYIDDVKARYNLGVTVYHYHPGVGPQWDFAQDYENWETDLNPLAQFTAAMITNLNINDDTGFTCKYIGDETLNGTTTYIEFKYVYQSTTYTENTQGMTIPQNDVVNVGERGQYQYGGATVSARIVDTQYPNRTSDWLTITL